MAASRLALSALVIAGLSALSAGPARAATVDLDWHLSVTHNTTITQGDTIRWTWTDGAPHTVTSQTGEAYDSSPAVAGVGTVFQHTFTQVGTSTYLCTVHPGSMTGSVTVNAPAPVPALPAPALWGLAMALGLCLVALARRRRAVRA